MTDRDGRAQMAIPSATGYVAEARMSPLRTPPTRRMSLGAVAAVLSSAAGAVLAVGVLVQAADPVPTPPAVDVFAPPEFSTIVGQPASSVQPATSTSLDPAGPAVVPVVPIVPAVTVVLAGDGTGTTQVPAPSSVPGAAPAATVSPVTTPSVAVPPSSPPPVPTTPTPTTPPTPTPTTPVTTVVPDDDDDDGGDDEAQVDD